LYDEDMSWQYFQPAGWLSSHRTCSPG